MIWGTYKYGVVQHVANDYASTLCDGRDIPDKRMKLWEFSTERVPNRRMCIRCTGVLIRQYDNEVIFRWVENTQMRKLRIA